MVMTLSSRENPSKRLSPSMNVRLRNASISMVCAMADSGVIDPLGRVLAKTKYNERTAIQTIVSAQSGETFYVKHGDYLARIAVVLTVLGLLFTLWEALIKGRKPKVRE